MAWLQGGSWQEASAMLAIVGTAVGTVWALVAGKIKHDETEALAKIEREKERRERDKLAFDQLKSLVRPYQDQVQALLAAGEDMTNRIECLEAKVAHLENENQSLRFGIRSLCEQLVSLGAIPVFCFNEVKAATVATP